MDEDQLPTASAEGVQSFMVGVFQSLHRHTMEKSAQYEIDFTTDIPFSSPRRYEWEHASSCHRPSFEPRPSSSTLDTLPDLPDLPALDPPAEEGPVSTPKSDSPVYRRYKQ